MPRTVLAAALVAVLAISCTRPPTDLALRSALLDRARSSSWIFDPPLEGEDEPIPGGDLSVDTLDLVSRSRAGRATEVGFSLRGAYLTGLRLPDLSFETPEHVRLEATWTVECRRDGTGCKVAGEPGVVRAARGRRSPAAAFESCAERFGRPFPGGFVVQEMLIDCWMVIDDDRCDGSGFLNAPERDIGGMVKGMATAGGCLDAACEGLDASAAGNPGAGIPGDWCAACLGKENCRTDLFPADGLGTAWLLTAIALDRMDRMAAAMEKDTLLLDAGRKELIHGWRSWGSKGMKALLFGGNVDFAALGYPGAGMGPPSPKAEPEMPRCTGAASRISTFVTRTTLAPAGGGTVDHQAFKALLEDECAIADCAAGGLPIAFTWAEGVAVKGYVAGSYSIAGSAVTVAIEKATVDAGIAGCVASAIAGSASLAGSGTGDATVSFAMVFSVEGDPGPSIFARIPEGTEVLSDPKPAPVSITRTGTVER